MLVLKTRRQKLERVAFSSDGRRLVTAGKYGVYWWSNPLSAPKAALIDNSVSLLVGLDPGGWNVVTESLDGALRIRNLNSARSSDIYNYPLPEFCSSSTISPVDSIVIKSLSTSKELAAWDISDTAHIRLLWKHPTKESIYSQVFAPDGGSFYHFAFFGWHSDDPLRLIKRATDTGEVIYTEPAMLFPVISGPCIFFDGSLLAYHTGDSIIIQELADCTKRIQTISNEGAKHFTALAFHPSGQWLAATSNDETVKLYDTTTWQVAKTFSWNIGRMRSIAFSPDGTLAAAGSDTGKVVIWDVD